MNLYKWQEWDTMCAWYAVRLGQNVAEIYFEYDVWYDID